MDDQGAVLVGLGDTDDGIPELDWAAQEATSTHRTLRVVRAWHPVAGMFPWDSSVDRAIKADLRAHANDRLARAREHLRGNWSGVNIDGRAVEGRPDKVLVDMSAGAYVTVLGSRRLGALGGVLVGSVSTIVAARAHGPVVIVAGPSGIPAEDPSVIVGVDGSATTQDVLSFAFDRASRRGRPLRAVFCLRSSVLKDDRAKQSAEERAQRWLAEILAGWQEKYPDVRVQRVIGHEHPVPALAAISAEQDLLVVGSHSAHARVGSLLGSVSQGVLHHASCPVAVVHTRG